MKKSIVAAVAAVFTLAAEAAYQKIASAFVNVAETMEVSEAIYDAVLEAMPASLEDEKASIASSVLFVKGALEAEYFDPKSVDWAFITVGGEVAKAGRGGLSCSFVVKFKDAAPLRALIDSDDSLQELKKAPVDGVDTYEIPAEAIDSPIECAMAFMGDYWLIAASEADSMAALADLIRSKPDMTMRPPRLAPGTVAVVAIHDVGALMREACKLEGIDLAAFAEKYAYISGDDQLVQSITGLGDARLAVKLTREEAGIDLSFTAGTTYDAEFLWHFLSYITMSRRYIIDAVAIAMYEEARKAAGEEDVGKVMAAFRDLRPLFADFITSSLNGRTVSLKVRVPTIPALAKLAAFYDAVMKVEEANAARYGAGGLDDEETYE